jgi:two-component system sensor histidine kinase CpxA
VRGTLILAARSFYNTPLFFDFKPWLAALAAAAAIFLICWLPFIRGITKTISRITRAAEQIGQGDFGRHLQEGRGDELGQLSAAINSMADQLAGFVKGQKRFLGDIAHELCAPIARMQFGLGILEQQATEAQKPAVADVQEEMGQMSALVGELLSFSKVGMESRERTLSAVDVRAIAMRAAEREAAPNARIQVEIPSPLQAMADPEYLLRSLSNLVRNAVRYAGEAGPITITAAKDRDQIVIQISDCGPGLPAEELEKVFTPFYRLEAARDREHGGVGLGLAIVRSCVEVCGGQVRCRNRQPSGLEVEIRLSAA